MFYPHPTRWGRSCFLFFYSRSQISVSRVLTPIITFCREEPSAIIKSRLSKFLSHFSTFSTVLAAVPRVKKSGPFPRTVLVTSIPINVSLFPSYSMLTSPSGAALTLELKYVWSTSLKQICCVWSATQRFMIHLKVNFHGLGGFFLTPLTPESAKPLSGLHCINCRGHKDLSSCRVEAAEF